MTPKEKAKDLVVKLDLDGNYLQGLNARKMQALICVNQIIENDYGSRQSMDFWKEVKQEIKKL